MEQKAHRHGVREERELLKVRIFGVRYLRSVVLVRTHIQVRCLVSRERGVFLDAVNLSEKRVRVIAVKMEKRELRATAADIEFGRAIVESRTQDLREPAIEPVREEIAR